jgi:hypothetical protein
MWEMNNKKLWEELIRLLSLLKPTVNNFVAMVTMEQKIKTHCWARLT